MSLNDDTILRAMTASYLLIRNNAYKICNMASKQPFCMSERYQKPHSPINSTKLQMKIC